jgi:DNA-binding CsgD family transcriptional regulator
MLAGAPLRAVSEGAEEAYALALARGDNERAILACVTAIDAFQRYGASSFTANAAQQEWLERGLRLAPRGSEARAHLDLIFAEVNETEGHWREAAELRRGVFALAQQLNDPDLRFHAGVNCLIWSLPPNQELRLKVAEDLSARSSEGVQIARIAAMLFFGGATFMDWGERVRAERLWRQLDDLAEHSGDINVLPRAMATKVIIAVIDGRLDDGLSAGNRLVATSEEHGISLRGHHYFAVWATRALGLLGRWDEALAAVERTIELAESEAPVVTGRRILCLAHLGRKDEASERLRVFLAGASGLKDESNYLPISVLIQLLEAAILVEDQDLIAELAKPLMPVPFLAISDWVLTCVARHLGAAADLLGKTEEARSYFEQAIQVCEDVSFRPEAALSRLGLAELLLKHYPEERAAALEQLDFVIGEFEAMGMEPALRRALRLRGRRRTSREPQTLAYPDGLSEREVEVLRLIARGHSNKQIADDLVLSIRTVERHIANLYAKAGVRTKAQATAYAHLSSLV